MLPIIRERGVLIILLSLTREMVNLRPGPKQGPPKIDVNLVPESTWLSSGPYIGHLILANREVSFFYTHTT